MKKVFLIILCVLIGMSHQAAGLHGDSNHLKYKFEYTFRGHVTGVFLFIFRYRFFFYANASVLLDARQTKGNKLEFQFEDIAEPGFVLRSWGFTGRTFLTGIATYDLDKTEALLATDKALLQKIEPEYVKYVRHWRRYPFQIRDKKNTKLSFSRDFNGIHKNGSIYLPVKRLRRDNKYYFNFKIYPMLLDMIKAYDHPFFTGNKEALLKLEPGAQWQSPPLDYSGTLNRVGSKATLIVAKYVKFKQKERFKLNYRVVSKTAKHLTIKGTAAPQAKIWGSFKIVEFTRIIQIRLPDGIVLEDSFHADISKTKDGNGGVAKCSLKMVQ
jgi:hypothetical protein